MNDISLIGVDLGGTTVSTGRIAEGKIVNHHICNISAEKSEETVLAELQAAIEQVITDKDAGIGIGVPGIVDVEKGIVFDVQNIPSWKEVYLKKRLENRFKVPVNINNDANCFVVGEKYFGKFKSFDNIVGLTIGTGLGAGLIINGHLYSGSNCGAGEIGEVPYKEHIMEYYCSGQFFKNIIGIEGKELFARAQNGSEKAKNAFAEFGYYLGDAIKTSLALFDPQAIVLGGSVSNAYHLFKETMFERVRTFPFQRSRQNLMIKKSELKHPAILGAAALYFDQMGN